MRSLRRNIAAAFWARFGGESLHSTKHCVNVAQASCNVGTNNRSVSSAGQAANALDLRLLNARHSYPHVLASHPQTCGSGRCRRSPPHETLPLPLPGSAASGWLCITSRFAACPSFLHRPCETITFLYIESVFLVAVSQVRLCQSAIYRQL